MRVLMIGALLLAALLPLSSQASPDTVPVNFSDSVVVSFVGSPTDISWLPDGTMLVTQQNGNLRVVEGGVLRATPALSLGSRVCTDFERGLLGVAVDPNFTQNGHIYLYYTFNKFNQNSSDCLERPNPYPVNRVSRFTMGPDKIIALDTEVVLIDNIPSPGGNHNGGDLLFGKDGMLYISIGDGGTDYAGGGSGGSNDAARDKHVLLGKILRITPSGGIPADNPFQGANTERCYDDGLATAGFHCQETWTWGLRNPFRIALDSNSATTRIFINDVGQGAREEINAGQAGADYGWNCYEGTRLNSNTGPCNPMPSNMIPPTYEYSHGAVNDIFNNCNSITGGAFVPNGLWPASYTGTYLFSDFACGKIIAITPNGSGGWTTSQFGSSLGTITSLEFGPDGAGQALYYTTYGGQVRRVRYTAGGNQAPTAELEAAPTAGDAPMTVNFDASASSDPESGALRYIWSFGDGTDPVTSTTATISHTYTAAGLFTAQVIVRDPAGLDSAPATVQIDTRAGDMAPSVSIDAPAPAGTFSVGEQITFSASGSDPEDGTLGADDLTLEVILHHDAHTHPFRSVPQTDTITFAAPAPEDLAAARTSYLELRATARDSVGNTAVVTQALLPEVVQLTVVTSPTGLLLNLAGTAVTTTQTLPVWAGWQLPVSAPSQSHDGQYWVFEAWSDGGAASHTVTIPTQPLTLTATFAPGQATYWLPIVRRDQ